HLSDWYTPSHIVHGFIFYFFAWAVFRKASVGWRFALAVFIEAAWEVVENTSWIIDYYRGNTASLNYYGDSIVNSVMDTIWMALGFLVAGLDLFAMTAGGIVAGIAVAVAAGEPTEPVEVRPEVGLFLGSEIEPQQILQTAVGLEEIESPAVASDVLRPGAGRRLRRDHVRVHAAPPVSSAEHWSLDGGAGKRFNGRLI
ncbi:MAG: DUF2585 family protein, partial [Reyranella sp.]|nr:DUF2585 family protein [Reyranella sp.]